MNPQAVASEMVERLPMPTSFNNDPMLLAVNLFMMTAFTYIGAMIAGAMLSGIWRHRRWDRWNHPVTLHRVAWACAGLGVMFRSGAEAAFLWAWNPMAKVVSPADVHMAVQMQVLKRYLDPLSLCFAGAWMIIIVLSHEAMVRQLRTQPLQVDIWARLPSLLRPAAIVMLAGVMAFGVVWTRG